MMVYDGIHVKAVNYYFGNGFFVNYAKTSKTMQNAIIAIFLDAVPPIKNELNEKVATEDPENPVFSYFFNVWLRFHALRSPN